MKYAQSRLRKKIITLSAFLFVAAFVWLDNKYHFIPDDKTPAAATQDINDWGKYNGKSFVVVKTIDGDTLDINIPDGRYAHTRIRLLGVDTPETKKPDTPVMYFGPEASNYTKEKTLGKKITVLLDRKSSIRDKYSRLLAHIQLENGKILNEELISGGFAYADTRFPQSFNKEYALLEKQAMKAKAGLWKKVTVDQMPKWRQKKLKNED